MFAAGSADSAATPASEPVTESSPAAPAATSGKLVRLDENRAVELAISHSLPIRLGLIGRETDRYSLRVARGRYEPVVSLGGAAGSTTTTRSPLAEAEQQSVGETTSLQPTASLYLPTGGSLSYGWTASYGVSRMRTGGALTSENQQWSGLGWTVSVSQPLLRGAGLKVGLSGLRQARLGEEVSRLSFQATVIAAVSNALQTLRGFIQAREALVIAERSLERGGQLLSVTEELLKAGRVPASDLTQAQADLAGRELSVVGARNAFDSARLRLARVLDLPNDTNFEVVVPERLDEMRPVYDEALASAYAERPDYRTALLALESADLALYLAKNSRLWDLNLVASYSEAVDPNQRNTASFAAFNNGLARPDVRGSFVGVTVNVPIWGDYSARQSVLGARNALRQAKLSQANFKEDIASEVLDRVRNLEMAWQGLKLARQSKDLAQKARDDEIVRLRAGLTSTLNVVRTEDAAVGAQNQELSAAIAYMNALTAFDQSTGTTLRRWQIVIRQEDGDRPSITPSSGS